MEKKSLSYSATHVCKSFGSTRSSSIKEKEPYTRAPFGVALAKRTASAGVSACQAQAKAPLHPSSVEALCALDLGHCSPLHRSFSAIAELPKIRVGLACTAIARPEEALNHALNMSATPGASFSNIV
jgi:hypothetical protein